MTPPTREPANRRSCAPPRLPLEELAVLIAVVGSVVAVLAQDAQLILATTLLGVMAGARIARDNPGRHRYRSNQLRRYDSAIASRATHQGQQEEVGATYLPVKRIALASATTLVALNIWTGAPLLALWVGSRVAGASGLSMGAVFLVVIVLGASVFALAAALTRLSAKYDQVTGRPASARRTSPWLRSMRGEREEFARKRQKVSAIERIIVLSVVACVTTFEVWFFFFAGSSLPKG